MAKVALFSSNASAVLAAFLLVGCAHLARDLPPDMSNLAPAHRLLPSDTTSPEYSMSCPELKAEIAATRAALSRTETQLQDIQSDNQSKVIVGLIFAPFMLAMEGNETMKTQYRDLDIKRERLLRIVQSRQCLP